MLKYGNKELRNLEEQVLKNQEDIKNLQSGIKISYTVPTAGDLTPLIKEENVGKYITVGTSTPKTLYVITHRANEGLIASPLGNWPIKGDKGDAGVQGDKGEKGDKGDRGLQGIQGIQGPVGHPGEGWSALDEIDSASYAPSVVDKVVETSADLKLAGGDSKVINLKYDLPIEGSEYISVDENADNEALVVELDETKLDTEVTEDSTNLITSGAVFDSLSTKLDATKNAVSSVGGLVTPTATPTEKEIVGVGTSGEQIRIQLGTNLSFSGGTSPYTLNATGGGGGTGIFVVEYEVTPFADIYAAIQDEKLPVIYETNYIYVASIYNAGTVIFEVLDTGSGQLHKIEVTSANVWTTDTKTVGTKWYKHTVTGTCGENGQFNYTYIFRAPWQNPPVQSPTYQNLVNHPLINSLDITNGHFYPDEVKVVTPDSPKNNLIQWATGICITWNYGGSHIIATKNSDTPDSNRFFIQTASDTVTEI